MGICDYDNVAAFIYCYNLRMNRFNPSSKHYLRMLPYSFTFKNTLTALLISGLLHSPLVLIPTRSYAQITPNLRPNMLASHNDANAGNSVTRLGKDKITLSFANAELEAVVRTVAELVGKTAVIDPRIKGTLNLQSDKPTTREQAYQQLLTQLRLAGYSAVDTGHVLRVVPEADGKLQGGAVYTSGNLGKQGDELLTQIFKLQNESAQTALNVVRPLVAPNNVVSATQGSNALIVTDYAENLQRIAKLLAEIDKPQAPPTEMIALNHASAVDIASVLQRLQDGTANTTGQTVARSSILAEVRSNSLIIKAASNLALEQTKQLISKLDVPSSKLGANNVNIVHLKNADATKLAATLRSVLSGDTTAAATPAATGTTPAAATASTGGMVQADATTNTLIITAPEPVYQNLRGIIEQLDVRRAQIYIESLIAEVSSEKAAQFGVQWLNGLSRAGTPDKSVTFGGTSFGASNNGVNIQTAAANPSALNGAGFVLGVANGVSKILGTEFLNLGFLAQALENETQANILSTPNVTTLDNEEAKVIIGQNVPFITGSYTQGSAGGASSNPFQTIERKDVGLTLKVRPQVSESGTIKLAIYQEISAVKDKTLAAGIITSKRSLETNVLVDNGQVVVIGGLIEDGYSDGVDKVPVLGDLPFVGNLFKSQSRKRTKTNLMIFLRPVIVSDAKGSELLSQERYEGIKALQEKAQPSYSRLLPINGAPVLPAFSATHTLPVSTSNAPMLQPSLMLSQPSLLKADPNAHAPQ
jgi:general secretion pathway protein D